MLHGGRLKLGYGPGGPPVLGHSQIVELVGQLRRLGFLKAGEIASPAAGDFYRPRPLQ